MKRRSHTTRRRGFTLFEVLLAMGLMMALVGMMFGFVFNLMRSRDRAIEYADRQLASSVLIDRLEAALMTSLVGDSRTGAGVAGDEHSITVLGRAVATSRAERGTRDPVVFGDLQQIEFRYDERRGLIEGRQSPVGPNADRDAYWPIGTVPKLRFRYHDGSTWRDSFDSLDAGRLPQAVEVAVWYAPWPGDEPLEEEPASEEEEDLEFERLTFDAEDTFDENEYIDMLDQQLAPPPPPDRVRVIVIPDAAPPDDEESIEFADVSEAAP